ncbi:MAG: ATP-binding protein [Bilifractor sp.]|jgi:two-component system phosphate regulon sensor histidine kinase PhoR
MTLRVFRSMFFLTIGILLVSFALSVGILNGYYTDISKSELRKQADLVAQGVSLDGEEYLESLESGDTRITWIDSDGTVLFASENDAGNMENHADREEIREALKEKSTYGESVRYSKTMMERYQYCAKKLSDGTVIRVSRSMGTVLSTAIGMIQPMCVVLVIAAGLSAFLASRLSKQIVRPLNELNLDDPLSNEEYDELAPLLRRMDKQQRQLRVQKSQLMQKQEELNTIVDNMVEGLILLGSKGNIVSINRAAERLLGAQPDCVGKDILTVNRNYSIQQAINGALDGHEVDRNVELRDSVYQVTASPVELDGNVQGAAVMLVDVTEREKSEKVRREFSANVSHELRTPLQSISGYAELLKNNMVRKEDVGPFGEKIFQEAQRMIRLVEDIINLSHLDEGAGDMDWDDVDLSEITRRTVDSLQPAAAKKRVELTYAGPDSLKVHGIGHLLQEIVYNLCDNAIKYNRMGGSVTVALKERKEKVVLSVKDTGIGIPDDEQDRVFERFYRVDKSHSREVGGTGLGLSIVKHAARVHGAKIDLKSKLGSGTHIKISFPKKRMA